MNDVTTNNGIRTLTPEERAERIAYYERRERESEEKGFVNSAMYYRRMAKEEREKAAQV